MLLQQMSRFFPSVVAKSWRAKSHGPEG